MKSIRKRAKNIGSGLLDSLFTSTQQKVLGLFFNNVEKQFSLKELITMAASGTGAVQREVKKLASADLIQVVQVGNQKLYTVNRSAPIYSELKNIIEKTSGAPILLDKALSKIKDEIDVAFIYGSFAKNIDTARSDVDLLIVSDKLDLTILYEVLLPVESELGRSVNPTLFTKREFKDRLRKKNAFLQKVLSGETIPLIGNADEIK